MPDRVSGGARDIGSHGAPTLLTGVGVA